MRFLLLLCGFAGLLFANTFYRLQGVDSSYDLLEDSPLIQKQKKLKSMNTQNRTPRPTKKPNYDRIDIVANKQALIRFGINPPKIRQHFLMLGLNSGIDLFTHSTKSKHIAIDLVGKIGYLYYFSDKADSNALRIYLNLGSPIPTTRAIPASVAGNINLDFLLNVIYFDLYIGGGYGGEYFIKNRFFSHGFIVNVGFSKRLQNHQIEFGLRVPFYSMLTTSNFALNHNIDFIVGYNYRF